MKLKQTLYACSLAALCIVKPYDLQAGAMWRAFFDNDLIGISGVTVDELVDATDFDRFGGNFPELLEERFTNIRLDGFNSDDGIDNFGSITHGYIQAPEDGEYILVLASDDNAELYLGDDHTLFPLRSPDHLIGFESAWTNGDIWTAARFEERSSTVTLEKGKIYFIEVLHKEGTGGSFVTVGWQRPDGRREIIPGFAMLPYGTSSDHTNEATSTEITVQPQDVEAVESTRAVFHATLFGPQPMTFQWLENGSPIEGANLQWLELETELADNGRAFSLRVTDGAGNTVTTSSAKLSVVPDTVPPRVVNARGSGFPKGIIVTFSEPVDESTATNPANYSISGQDLTVTEATLLSDTEVLINPGEYANQTMTLSVSNVRDRSSAGNPVPANSQAFVGTRSSLNAYWPFDEGSGDIAIDVSGGFSGELLGGPSWSTDTPNLGERNNGFAVAYDGVDDYILTTYPGVAGPRQRTVSFWMKTTTATTHGIVGWGDSSRNQTKYHVRIQPSTGSIRTEVQGGNNWATTPVNDGVWHHVVSLVPDMENPNNSDVLHYVDGVLDPRLGGGAQGINTDIAAANSLPVMIGARRQGSATAGLQPFEGLVDDLAIFDVALTDEEIAALAAGENPMTFAVPTTGPLSALNLPTDKTGFQLGSVTFSIEVTGSDPASIGYQWFRSGSPIQGANTSTYTLDPLSLEDDGSTFSVQAFNLDGTYANIVSDEFTLIVLEDTVAPEIVSLRGISGGVNKVVIQFSEGLLPATAVNLANYSIDGLTISAAEQSTDGTSVTLTTSTQMEGETYSLTVTGVRDLAGPDNVVDTTLSFTSTVTYFDQVLADNPDGYWRLGESSGDIANNTATSNWNGTYNSGTGGVPPLLGADSLVPNTRNKAARFVAAEGNRILIPDNAAINTGGPYEDKTIEMWIHAESLPSLDPDTGAPTRAFLFEQGGTTRGLSLSLVATESENAQTAELVFHGWNDNSDGIGSPWGGPESEGKTPIWVSTTIEVGETYHVVMVLDGDPSGINQGTLSGYVNGQLAAGPIEGVGLFYNAGDDAGFGAVNQNTITRADNLAAAFDSPFDGVLDEIAYYNTALSSERILAHYETGLKPTEEPEPSDEVTLNITLEAGQATLSWEPAIGTLQSAGSVDGPWTSVQGTSPVVMPADETQLFRVQLP